jgi:predicted nucleotidyltransferase
MQTKISYNDTLYNKDRGVIDIEKLKPQIIEILKPLNPEKIILFSSYAYGAPNEENDIDLYVVTNDDFMLQTWKEKNSIHASVSKAIKDISLKYPTDLITHTKAMYEKFIEMDSMFSRKIPKDSIRLL